MAETLTLNLKVETSNQTLENTTEQIEKIKKSSKETTEGFSLMDSKLGGMWKTFSGGAKTAVSSLTTLKGAIAATGVGLLILAFSALVNYFKSTDEGSDKLAQGMAALGTVIKEGPIVVLKALKIPLDIVVGYFKTLFSVISNTIGVITGKVGLSEAIKNVGEEFKKNTDKVKEDTIALIDNGKQAVERVKESIRIKKEEQTLEDQIAINSIKKSKIESEISDLREKAITDKKANVDLLKKENELYIINKEEAEKNLKIVNAKIANENDLVDAIQLRAEAEKKLFDVEQAYTQSTLRSKKQLAALDKQEADKKEKDAEDQLKAHKEEEEARQELYEKEKERQDKALEEEKERQDKALEEEKERKEREDKAAGEFFARQIELQQEGERKKQEFADNEKQRIRDEQALKEENTNRALSSASNSLSQLSELAGRQSKAGKALAITATIIDTLQSAVASYKSLAGIPVVGVPLGIAAAAAATATGLATVAKIRSTPDPKLSHGGYLIGPSHANGGIMYGNSEVEGDEFILNSRTMKNPQMARMAMAMNTAGNNGAWMNNQSSITETRVAEIASQVVKSIPVVATEYRTSLAQRNVSEREGRFTV